MYLDFYKFREPPFSLRCDQRFFYESAVHAEALANMMYTIQHRKGMVLITGEVGAGKTFVGHVLRARLGAGCMTALVANPPQSAKQFLRALAGQIGIRTPTTADKLSLVEQLEDHLRRLASRGRLVALIVDDAQDLPNTCLEEIRLLWNWETDGQGLMQMVLIGQPELRSRLRGPRWEPLRQRVTLSYHLSHLSEEDTAKYVRHRLAVAADGECRVEFTPEAIRDVHAATDGIPRLINVLCDNALLVAYGNGQFRIEGSTIAEVLSDMTCWELRAPQPIVARG